jgi:hypothetical protein
VQFDHVHTGAHQLGQEPAVVGVQQEPVCRSAFGPRWSSRLPRARAARAEKKARRRGPGVRCGRITNVYGRKQPELGLLCQPCLITTLADQRRGWTADEMIVMYRDEQMSTNEIAAITGLSQSGVHAIVVRRGVQMRSVQDAIALHSGGQREHGKVDREEIGQLYPAGTSITKIATEVACSRGTVQYHLTKLGLLN